MALANPRVVYLLRLMSAATQLVVVFFLSSISVNTLGSYSFATAILAIGMQALQFEGTQLAIGGLVRPERLRRIYATTNVVWLAFTIGTVAYFHTRPDILVFTLLFIFNLTSEWTVNLLSIEERMAKSEQNFLRNLSIKIAVIDVAIPWTLVVWAYTMELQGLSHAAALLAGAIILISVKYIGIVRRFSHIAWPNFNFIHGVVVKRLDGMFIRVFTGLTMGSTTLGVVQPLLSVARTLNILTPTWININFSGSLQHASSESTQLWKIVKILALTYVAYVAFGFLLFFGFSPFEEYNYSIFLCLAAAIFFGNQNTKAVTRSLNIMQNRLGWNNALSNMGLIAKIPLGYIFLSHGIIGIFFATILADLMQLILILLFMRAR